jgi:hypothetical protein
MSSPGGHAAPDAIAFIVLDGPLETIGPNGAERTNGHGAETAVGVERKPQIGVVPRTRCGLSPRGRVWVKLVTRWGEVWRNQENTQFLTR